MEEENREIYRECLRNHAASLGSYATDGCGEFTFDDTSPSGSSSLHCAACGCHRNFHRKVVTHASPTLGYSSRSRDLDYMALTAAAADSPPESDRSGSGSKKRFRTKFTAEQKEKMLEFADKLGWKLLRKDLDDEIDKFCRSLGVTRQVFKVWMHNHKNGSSNSSMSASTGNASSLTTQ